ncbi:hypothetical protein TSAR_013640 [Trichomalopsis sarcophagae]|uniref:Uncharacterized protein n=1 Tax=Trichomalopsis sarcophagae TaxID=543379 RepID=A0A232EW95_9HYME|nr:hypothetical protein TSAR_013640 [Trichomalopsis sarcophagae]
MFLSDIEGGRGFCRIGRGANFVFKKHGLALFPGELYTFIFHDFSSERYLFRRTLRSANAMGGGEIKIKMDENISFDQS